MLPFEFENVCLAMDKDRGLYAVGSQSDVSFFDLRTDKTVLIIRTQDVGAGGCAKILFKLCLFALLFVSFVYYII